jgi:AcrR family transcriptional regulator
MAEAEKEQEGRPDVLALMWAPEEAARRGPKRAMSIATIVEAAIAIADEGGVAAVSMSAVAKRLGFTPMSLYRYIASKDDLLLLMVDAGYGTPPESIREQERWQDVCRAWAMVIRDRYLAHPWILDVPIKGPPLTPNQLLALEYFLEGMAPSGLADHHLLSSALLLSGYVMNQTRLERDLFSIPSNAEEANRQFHTLVTSMEARGTFPRLAELIRSGFFADDEEDFEFEFGLERIIAGMEALVRSRKSDTECDS